MAHIPMEDTDLLWQQTKEKSWSGLRKNLEQRQGKAEGIEDALVKMMIKEARQMEEQQAPYPGSAQELNQVLNENLPQ